MEAIKLKQIDMDLARKSNTMTGKISKKKI